MADNTNGTPPPTWTIEPTLLFVVIYYPTNAEDENPTVVNLRMRDYNAALEVAKQTIVDNNNEGVAIIQQVTSTIVYPPTPWEDF